MSLVKIGGIEFSNNEITYFLGRVLKRNIFFEMEFWKILGLAVMDELNSLVEVRIWKGLSRTEQARICRDKKPKTFNLWRKLLKTLAKDWASAFVSDDVEVLKLLDEIIHRYTERPEGIYLSSSKSISVEGRLKIREEYFSPEEIELLLQILLTDPKMWLRLILSLHRALYDNGNELKDSKLLTIAIKIVKALDSCSDNVALELLKTKDTELPFWWDGTEKEHEHQIKAVRKELRRGKVLSEEKWRITYGRGAKAPPFFVDNENFMLFSIL